MPSVGCPHRSPVAVGAVFFVNGAMFASWIPRIPEVQARLGLSASALGLVLAGVGLGGLVGTLLSPALVAGLGSRRAAVGAGAGVALTLPVVALAPSGLSLGAVLFVAGLFDAVTDIAMNDLGVSVQRRARRSLMNRLHAGWSLGSVAGALVSSAVAASGVGVGVHFGALGLVSTAVLARVWPGLPAEPPVPGPSSPRRSRMGAALVLLPLAFATAVVEGVPGEWSGVFLADVHGLGAGTVGIGYTCFAAGMLIGRLAGDAVIDRAGMGATSRVAGGLVLVGLATTVSSVVPALAVAGFGLMGLGTSVLFPVVYGAAGSLSVVSSGGGLALLSLGARLGFLAGSPLVGLVTDATNLRAALGILVVAGLAGVAGSRARLDRYAA